MLRLSTREFKYQIEVRWVKKTTNHFLKTLLATIENDPHQKPTYQKTALYFVQIGIMTV